MALREGELLGIGNALLDVTVSVDHDFLAKHDIGVNQAVRGDLFPDRTQLLKEIESHPGVCRTAGGSGLNVIRAAQWIFKTPSISTFIGCIGNDKNGDVLVKCGQDAGVQLVCQVVDCPTSVCLVLVTGAERSMCSFQYASGKFDFQKFLQADTQRLFERASVIYLSGFFLNVCTTTATYVAKKCSETRKKLVLDLGAPRVVKAQAETIRNLLPFTDVLFGNDAEYAALGDILGLEGRNVIDVCRYVANSIKTLSTSGRTVVMTQGLYPVVVADSSNELIFFPCATVPPEELVDVNGAGDAFLGGFLAEYVRKAPVADCVASGLSMSQLVLRHTGCSFV